MIIDPGLMGTMVFWGTILDEVPIVARVAGMRIKTTDDFLFLFFGHNFP